MELCAEMVSILLNTDSGFRPLLVQWGLRWVFYGKYLTLEESFVIL